MFVVEWSYLILIQVIILVIYYLSRKKTDEFELNKFFQSKMQFLIMNLGVIATCIYLNIQRQLFCIPVVWTSILLALFCISFILFPFINKNSKIFTFITAFAGLGFFISIYIILFGRQEYLIYLGVNFVLTIPIIFIIWILKKITKQSYYNALWFYFAFTFAPYFIIFQLILMFRALRTKTQKAIYISSSIFVLLIGLFLTIQMNTIFKKISTTDNIELELKTLNKNPINSYLTELILGAHWKYHTELCNYDGWRPPYHDPVLVIANKILFPYEHFGHGTNIPVFYDKTLYKKLYPENATKFNCRCAVNERLLDL